ncbi:MAG: TRAP transporter small permease subunit [Elusimicrobiales bacterium]|nr:TRAP transporter small permease subunit [Elusimicrobiales bacterium]
MDFIFKTENIIVKAEKGIIVSLIAAMVILSFMQVLLRIIFHSGIVWLDPLLRHCVLWAGFAGAALAARYSRHFALDLCSRFAPQKLRRPLQIAVAAFAAAAAGMLFYASCKFIADEFSSGSTAFYVNHFAVKGYIAEIIIPVAFFLVMCHFILGIFRPEDGAELSAAGEAAK